MFMYCIQADMVTFAGPRCRFVAVAKFLLMKGSSFEFSIMKADQITSRLSVSFQVLMGIELLPESESSSSSESDTSDSSVPYLVGHMYDNSNFTPYDPAYWAGLYPSW